MIWDIALTTAALSMIIALRYLFVAWGVQALMWSGRGSGASA